MGYRPDNHSSIGGWLAVSVVALGIISPGLTLADMRLLPDPPVTTPLAGSLTLSAVIRLLKLTEVVVHCALAWVLLRRRRRSTIRLTLAMLWLMAMVDIFLLPVAVSATFGLPIKHSWRLGSWWMWKPLVGPVVWSAYLLSSKRVAATYPAKADAEPTLTEVFR